MTSTNAPNQLVLRGQVDKPHVDDKRSAHAWGTSPDAAASAKGADLIIEDVRP